MRLLTGLAGIALVACSMRPSLRAEEPVASNEANYWMTRKLELSQEILAGLAMEDFETLANRADQLERLSRVEGWARRTHADTYRRELKRFRRAASMLRDEAEGQNLDGATLAFHHLTLSCITCHQQLRSETPAP